MATDNESNVANAFFSSALGPIFRIAKPRCSHCWRRSRNSWNPWLPTLRSSSNPCLSLSWPSWNHWLNLSKPRWRISLRRWWPRPKPCFPSKATGLDWLQMCKLRTKKSCCNFWKCYAAILNPSKPGNEFTDYLFESLETFKGDHIVTFCFLW